MDISKIKWEAEPALGTWYTNKEIKVVYKTLQDSLNIKRGFNANTEIAKFEKGFKEYIGVKYSVAVNSAGTGLDIAMKCLDLEPGDEVISCAINFPGTHLAILGEKASLILCEPNPITLNIDPYDIERKITNKTKAVVVTHMNGLSADMDEILNIIKKHRNNKRGNINIISDAARSCGGEYKNEKIGKKGLLNIFSFHSKKIISTLGEGGMITTNNKKIADKIIRMRSFGRGVDWGTNYKITKLQAAVGLIQLKRLDTIIEKRKKLAQERNELLTNIDEITLPIEPENYKHVYSYYTLILPSKWAGKYRDAIIRRMRNKYGIGCAIANRPTYLDNKYICYHTKGQYLPISNSLGKRIICPSIHPLMTKNDNIYIVESFIHSLKYIGLI
jgi:dTDP-4-amino-4,6-dideoxygalactose transaminase